MKKISFIIVGLSALLFISCQKDTNEADTAPIQNKAKILGKWKLESHVEKYYEPVNTLTENYEYIGEAGDSVVFRSDDLVYSYTPRFNQNPEISDYKLKGLNKIEIDDEEYTIVKLTDTQLHLYIEEIEAGTKWTYAIFLYR